MLFDIPGRLALFWWEMEEEWIRVKKEVRVGWNLKKKRELWSGYDVREKKILERVEMLNFRVDGALW